MPARHRLPVVLAALLFGAFTTAQEPTPAPPATGEAAGSAPAPASQDPQAGRRGRRGQRPDGSAAGDAAAGAQDQKPGGNRGRPESQDLPEFTPVAAPPLAGLSGKQFFWFTIYPDLLVKFDPATDKVVDKVQLLGGMFWSTSLTHDQKRMLVVTNQQQSVEVIDLKTGKHAGSHLFQEEGYVLRIRSIRECPGGVCWLVRTDRVKKELDRYSFEPSQWLLYDSAQQKVLRKMKKLPDALDRDARLSADGTQWLASDDDGNLTFLDARTFKELGRIDLRTPRFFGAGPIRLTGTDLLEGRDPARARMLFTSTDPVETRRTNWGVVELDLVQKRIVDVVEWGPNQRSWGLRVAPKKLIGAMMTGGRGENESRLSTWDLRTGKKIAEAYYEFRPRRSLVAISPDADKIYVGVAGSDFEVFDADLKRLPTVELEAEIVGRIHVVDG